LDEQIAALQEQKKAIYSQIRRDFGRHNAEGMKFCVRLAAMDTRQRAEQLEFNALGLSFLNMLKLDEKGSPESDTLQAANDDWRAQRERDRAIGFEDEASKLPSDTVETINAK